MSLYPLIAFRKAEATCKSLKETAKDTPAAVKALQEEDVARKALFEADEKRKATITALKEAQKNKKELTIAAHKAEGATQRALREEQAASTAATGAKATHTADKGKAVVQTEQAASTAASAGEVINAGKILGKFGIPEYYTYTFGGKSVFVSPNAMKHLTELATHGAGNPNYLKLLGQIHQKALHSAINDVLPRGKIAYQKMYYSGGNEIMFAAPRCIGELPAVIHFR